MVEMDAIYMGSKHCEITHGPSQAKIETDNFMEAVSNLCTIQVKLP